MLGILAKEHLACLFVSARDSKGKPDELLELASPAIVQKVDTPL
jgi:hypothetical protein